MTLLLQTLLVAMAVVGFAMLVDTNWTAHENKRCRCAIAGAKPLITEASEGNINQPQRRAMPSSVTSRGSRAHARRRTARGPPRASLV